MNPIKQVGKDLEGIRSVKQQDSSNTAG